MKKALLLLVFSMSCLFLSAQPDTEEPPGDPFNGDPDQAVPITGLEWLLAGGCVLGLKRIIHSRKNGDKDE